MWGEKWRGGEGKGRERKEEGSREGDGGDGRGKTRGGGERRGERQAASQRIEDPAKPHPDCLPTEAVRSMLSEAIQFWGNLLLPNR